MRSSSLILFICTGNYYRSRFAEAIFNHEADARGLAWRAISRGLAIHLASGDLSGHVAAALTARRIPLNRTGPTRTPLAESDFHRVAHSIALKRTEHQPLLENCFPTWSTRVTYWDIADVDEIHPRDALSAIEEKVKALLARLPSGASPTCLTTAAFDPA